MNAYKYTMAAVANAQEAERVIRALDNPDPTIMAVAILIVFMLVLIARFVIKPCATGQWMHRGELMAIEHNRWTDEVLLMTASQPPVTGYHDAGVLVFGNEKAVMAHDMLVWPSGSVWRRVHA